MQMLGNETKGGIYEGSLVTIRVQVRHVDQMQIQIENLQHS
jgi:hypothetical protein